MSPTNTATSTPPPAASLQLSASAITPYQSLTVTGTTFAAGEPITVLWDNTPITGTTSASDGSFVARFTVPPAVAGVHSVAAQGLTSLRSASATLTINPLVIQSQTAAAQGARVTLSGAGFGPGEQVWAYWEPGNHPVGSPITTTSLGTFGGTSALTMTVPYSPTGTYAVAVVGQNSKAAVAIYSTVLPALSVTPASGSPGSAVTIVGTGYRASESVTVLWNCATATCASTTALGTAQANANGVFGMRVPLPAAATPGQVYALGGLGASGTFATTPFTVTS